MRSGRQCARLDVKRVREPGAGNPHARFDERGGETERWTSRRDQQRKTLAAIGAAGPVRHRASPRLYHITLGFPFWIAWVTTLMLQHCPAHEIFHHKAHPIPQAPSICLRRESNSPRINALGRSHRHLSARCHFFPKKSQSTFGVNPPGSVAPRFGGASPRTGGGSADSPPAGAHRSAHVSPIFSPAPRFLWTVI